MDLPLIGDTKEIVNICLLSFRWLNGRVISWQCEAMSEDPLSVGFVDSVKPPCTFPSHSKDCMFSCKPDCGSDGPVFVILIENDKINKDGAFRKFYLVDTLPLWHEELAPQNSLLDIMTVASPETIIS